jgi:hypothetical protein
MDYEALYRGESRGEGIAPMTTPPWDTKAPNANVIAWQTGGWIHGNVLDIGCGLGDNAVYLANSEYEVTGDVLGGAGWDITSLEPATVRGALDGGSPAEMAFWYLRAQRTLAALTAVLPSTTTESGAFRIRLRCA